MFQADQLFPYLTAVPVGELLEVPELGPLEGPADTPPSRVVGPLKMVVAGTPPPRVVGPLKMVVAGTPPPRVVGPLKMVVAAFPDLSVV